MMANQTRSPAWETDPQTWLRTAAEGPERWGSRPNLRETWNLLGGVMSELR